MKIAVCDDDRAAREQLASFIREQEPEAEVTVFASGEEMIRSGESFAISFLDVEMGEVSGLEVARHIRRQQESMGGDRSILIFVTGYREYMEAAFDVNAFHYLVKPVEKKRFEDVFGRACRELRYKEMRQDRHILIKSDGMQKKVWLKDIYYIESSNKKVVFHTRYGKTETYGKMEDWQSVLGDTFYRCHRGYLVNLEKISAYNGDTIRLVNQDAILLAKKRYADFIRAYMRYAQDGGIVNV